MKGHKNLSRRERQIMDIIYELGEASVAQVLEKLPNPPSYSAARALLRILEEKDHLSHRQDGPRYMFVPTVPHSKAGENALKHLLQTFFENSTEKAVVALLNLSEDQLSAKDYHRILELIEQAQKEGR